MQPRPEPQEVDQGQTDDLLEVCTEDYEGDDERPIAQRLETFAVDAMRQVCDEFPQARGHIDRKRELIQGGTRLISTVCEHTPNLAERDAFIDFIEQLAGTDMERGIHACDAMYAALSSQIPRELQPWLNRMAFLICILDIQAWMAEQRRDARKLEEIKDALHGISGIFIREKERIAPDTNTNPEARNYRFLMRIAYLEFRLQETRFLYRSVQAKKLSGESGLDENYDHAIAQARYVESEVRQLIEASGEMPEIEALKYEPDIQRLYAEASAHLGIVLGSQYVTSPKISVSVIGAAQRTFGYSETYLSELFGKAGVRGAIDLLRVYTNRFDRAEPGTRPQQYVAVKWAIVGNLTIAQEYEAAIKEAEKSERLAEETGSDEFQAQLQNVVGICMIWLAEKLAQCAAEPRGEHSKKFAPQAASILGRPITSQEGARAAVKRLLEKGIEECEKSVNGAATTKNVLLFRAARCSVAEGVLHLCDHETNKETKREYIEKAHNLIARTGEAVLQRILEEKATESGEHRQEWPIADDNWCTNEAAIAAGIFLEGKKLDMKLADIPNRPVQHYRDAQMRLEREMAAVKGRPLVPDAYRELVQKDIDRLKAFIVD